MRAAAINWGLGRIVKDEESVSDAIGLYLQTWTYPESGIELVMGSEEPGAGKRYAQSQLNHHPDSTPDRESESDLPRAQ